MQDFSATGLTSNPTIFDHAIKNSRDYDGAIRLKMKDGKSGEALFSELAIGTSGSRSRSSNPRPNRRCGRQSFA
jgi:transaldolase